MFSMRFYFLFSLLLFFFANHSFAQPPCEHYLKSVCDSDSDTFQACDLKNIRLYTRLLYSPLNAHLRKINPDKACEKISKSFIQSLSKLPPVSNPVRVYRGVWKSPKLENLKPGDCFADWGIVSTSTSEEVASRFAKDNDRFFSGHILMKIDTWSGRDISAFSAKPGEKEIIILPNVPLKLRKITGDNVNLIMEFVEIRQDKCRKIIHDLRNWGNEE